MTRLVSGNKAERMFRNGTAAKKPAFDATRTLAMVKDGDVVGPLFEDEKTALRPLVSLGDERTMMRPAIAAPTTQRVPVIVRAAAPVAVAPAASGVVRVATPSPVFQPVVIVPRPQASAPAPAPARQASTQPAKRSRGLVAGLAMIGTTTLIVVGLLFAGSKLTHGRGHEAAAAAPIATQEATATPTVLALDEPAPPAAPAANPVAPVRAQPIAQRTQVPVVRTPTATTPVATTTPSAPATTTAPPASTFTTPPTASDPDPSMEQRDAKKLTEEADKELLNLLPPK